jgi:hydrophobic/amphiphilic exporter-1 (mainly G- bacteria), HAE1 family
VELDISIAGGGPGGMGGGGWGPRGMQISLVGPDMDVLREYSYRIEDRLEREDWVTSVSNPRTQPMPELEFHIDREFASRIDASSGAVANAFGTQARGSRAGFFRESGREIPIEVRNVRDRFQNRDDLFSLEVLQLEDARVPITALGTFHLEQSMSRISRRDREVTLDLSIMVRGSLEEYRPMVTEILNNDIILPDGYRYDFTGRLGFQDDSAREMGIAFIFALILTYMVMASLFENFRDPFIIMFTVPLAFFGSLIFLFITSTSLSVPAYIGVVILIGIVVNNGIVLVDYIHQYTGRSQAVDKAYLITFLQACKRRMRPILLTAMTTIFP